MCIYFKYLVFTICCFMNLVNYGCGQESTSEETKKQRGEQNLGDHHTFVAMIDIVFTDGSKRTCTGAIIHDNVVITAAHCFVSDDLQVKPELTTSFVVIGTKNMFETGYELYLPIERVVTHPQYKGWTADLSLVFTFAGMTSDKPGTIIPLAGNKASTPVDSNVTVLSWGHYKGNVVNKKLTDPTPKMKFPSTHIADADSCDENDKKEEEYEPSIEIKPAALRQKHSEEEFKKYKEYIHKDKKEEEYEPSIEIKPAALRQKHSEEEFKKYKINKLTKEKQKQIHMLRNKEDVPRYSKSYNFDIEEYKIPDRPTKQHVSHMSRYHPSNEHDNYYRDISYKQSTKRPISSQNAREMTRRVNKKLRIMITVPTQEPPKRTVSRLKKAPLYDVRSYYINWRRQMGPLVTVPTQEPPKPTVSRLKKAPPLDLKSYYTNWRRQMGPLENRLTAESFDLTNVQMCKKIVEKAMPAIFAIKYENDVVCYSSEDHYITTEDSGAPAIRNGQLVAVTVGGAECEDERVGLGMKMSCYCSWIAQHLPGGGDYLNCCKDCCNVRFKANYDETITRFRAK